MSTFNQQKKRPTPSATPQHALPPDIHGGVMSPAPSKLSSKAQALGTTSAKLANSSASHGRKIQTVARDPNSKLQMQRSTSRGANVRDFRGIRTDRREVDDHYGRPDSRGAEDSLDQDGDREESKERTLTNSSQHNNSKFERTQPLGSIANTNRSTQNTLRESHDSMRSIQKQRIQRSLQKSQEGRKKLEEKLEAISTRDRQFYAQNGSLMTSMNSAAVSGNNQDGTNIERAGERNEERYEERHNRGLGSGEGPTGSLLATKGGFQNLRNKDQIRDQMLASISKIKSFRETGEFDMSGISAIQSVSEASMAHASDRVTGLSDVHIEAPPEFQTNNRERCSDQVLIAEPRTTQHSSIDHSATSTRQPQNIEQEAFQESGGNRGTYQTAHFHNQANRSQDHLSNLSSIHHFQSTKSATNMNSKINIGSQLHIINAQLKNKICNTIEEAQPFLKMCLIGGNSAAFTSTQGVSTSTMGSISGANESDQFSSIISNTDSIELDKNLICPKCNYIVVGPVECQSCQYIICYKCAHATGMICDDEACGEKFTSTPGKIHKLYKEMLYQLEFRCPNQGQGCTRILKYDQLDLHLQKSCEARQQLCPNRCSKTQKFAVQLLQKHLDEDCPKECLPCPECKQIKFRMEIEEHLATSCDKVLVKCGKCSQTDLRAAFKSGKHDCIALRNEDHQYDMALRRSGEKRRDREPQPRDYDDFARLRHDEDEAMFDTSMNRNAETILTGPVTQAQVRIVKDEIQNIQKLIAVDIFQMIDTFSKALTSKEHEVDDVNKRLQANEEEMQLLMEQNNKLEKQVNQANQQFSQMQSQFVQQADRYQELVTNLTAKQSQQAKKIDELQQALLQKLQHQDKKIDNQEDKIKEANQKFIQQTNKHAEVIAKMSHKQEQNWKLMKSQEEFMENLSQSVQSQINHKANEDRAKDSKIEELARLIETVSGEQTMRDDNYDELIASLIKKFDNKINHVLDVQLRQQEENDQFQKFVIDQVKKSQEHQEQETGPQEEEEWRGEDQADHVRVEQRENLGNLSIKAPTAQNFFQEEQKQFYHESTVSESLDEEILAQHYAKHQYQTEQLPFQRNLKVPPINLPLPTSLAKKHMKRKSPKHQKHYSEDMNNGQALNNKNDWLQKDTRQKEEVSQQIRQQLYPAAPKEIQEDNDSPMVEIANNAHQEKREEKRDQKKARDLTGGWPTQSKEEVLNIEEIVEDIDESQFIPAYLSACENDRDITDLNRTELNTEYNTARPMLGAYGGQTDRISSKGSQKYKDRSEHNSARKGQAGRSKKGGGGLTDRERGTMPLTSEVQSSLQSTYRISQSTQRQPDNRDSKDSSSDDIMRSSPRQVLIEDQHSYLYSKEQNKAPKTGEQPESQQQRKPSEKSDNQSFINESDATLTELQKMQLNHLQHPIASDFQDSQGSQEEVNQSALVGARRQAEKMETIHEERKSVPSALAQPYNDHMAKTYDSSEFEQQSLDGLPGNIFGCGIRPAFGHGSAAPPKELTASKISLASKASRDSANKHSKATFQYSDKAGLRMTSPMTSDQSLGNLQVNLDQNLSQFYALAQNDPLKMTRDNSSQGRRNTTSEQSQLQSKALQSEDRIQRAQDDFNPYNALEGNQIMSHTLKVEKMKQENFIEQMGAGPKDQEEYKKIEHDIQHLRQKYQNEMVIPQIDNYTEEFAKSIKTDDQLQQALKDLEQSHDDKEIPQSSLRGKNSQKLQPRESKNSQGQSDNSEFERDEGSNGENIDNIIHQILEGDDLFKRKKEQSSRLSGPDAIKQDHARNWPSSMPFELGKQSSRDTSNTQHEVDQILAKAQQEPDRSDGRRANHVHNQEGNSSKTSDEERESTENGLNSNSKDSKDIELDLIQDDAGYAQNVNGQPFPTGLESDLETILETDQESNYMTTARTNQQKSIISTQAVQVKQQPSAPAQKQTELYIAERSQAGSFSGQRQESEFQVEAAQEAASTPRQDYRLSLLSHQSLNQSRMSLNDSSFVMQDARNSLPQNIYDLPLLEAELPQSMFDVADDKPARPRAAVESLDDDSQLFKTETKALQQMQENSGDKRFNYLLNDISPIAHALEASSYQNTRYTDILDSARTDGVNRDANEGSTQTSSHSAARQARNNPYKPGYSGGLSQEFISSDLPRQLFMTDTSKGQAMASPSQDNMVSDRSINSNSIHIHFPDEQNAQGISQESRTQSKAEGRQGLAEEKTGLIQSNQQFPERDAAVRSLAAEEEEKITESRLTSQKNYYDKVLSAISDSAKKKQQEQKDILKQIEVEMEIKRQNQKLPNTDRRQGSGRGGQDDQGHGGEHENSPQQTRGAGPRQPASQEHARRADALDRDSIEQELQMIIRRNRSAYEQKYEQPAPEKDT